MRGGQVIARARRWSNLRADELADRLGVATTTVEDWEQGDPGFSVVEQAVEASGQPLALVISEPDPDPHDVALIEDSLRLTVEQRVARLVNHVRFVEAARRAMRAAR